MKTTIILLMLSLSTICFGQNTDAKPASAPSGTAAAKAPAAAPEIPLKSIASFWRARSEKQTAQTAMELAIEKETVALQELLAACGSTATPAISPVTGEPICVLNPAEPAPASAAGKQ